MSVCEADYLICSNNLTRHSRYAETLYPLESLVFDPSNYPPGPLRQLTETDSLTSRISLTLTV